MKQQIHCETARFCKALGVFIRHYIGIIILSLTYCKDKKLKPDLSCG